MKINLFMMLFLTICFFLKSFGLEQKEIKVDEFKHINCDEVENIKNVKLLFIQSKDGFIYNLDTESPLQGSVPHKIRSSTQFTHTNTIVLQDIYTKPLEEKIIEPSVPSIVLYTITAVFGIIGFFITPFLRKSSFFN